jgi:toxin ParE1/3/4
MAGYRLSNTAVADVERIYQYSILNFGLTKANTYIDRLHDRLSVLNEQPHWGNAYAHIAPELKRYEYGAHSIYYEIADGGIFIIRVLGNRQDPARHF